MRNLLLALLVASLSQAAETYVVAAGVEKYDDSGISTLAYAATDAKTFAEALQAAGVPAGNIKLYTSDATDFRGRPTRSNLLRALQWGREMCRPGDTLIFLFSGHGIQQGDEAYLLTIDSNRALPAETALPARLIPKALDGFQGAHLLLIVDACRNNPAAGKGEENAALDERFAKAMRPRLDPAASSLPEPAVLLACAAGERAWEMPEQGSGALVYWLLRGLTGEAGETDGGVKLSDLAAYVEREVPAWARRAKQAQHPTFANPGADFTLPKVPANAVRPIAAPKEGGTGEVMVRSDPPGATVRIGGREAGQTPLTLDLPPGEHEVTATLDGHQPATVKVKVRPGDIVMTEVLQMPALPGTVVVGSEPPGGRVYLDGRDSGQVTPCALKLPPGEVRVKVELAGHESREEAVTVVADRTLRLPTWRLPEKIGWAAQEARPAEWPGYLQWPPSKDPALRFRVSPKDGMPQVLIPAGEFLMGSTAEEQEGAYQARRKTMGDQAKREWYTGEGPQKRVFVSAFWMDLHEVTNEQYCRFLNSTRPSDEQRKQWLDLKGQESNQERATKYLGSQIEQRGTAYVPETGKERHPMIWVSWEGAAAYAQWAGRPLPTEAQWERAARGGRQTKYVWGDNDSPPPGAGNLSDETAAKRYNFDRSAANIFLNYDDGQASTAPVGSFAANGFGLFDMAGNVYEWCRDWYDAWYARMPGRDPINTTQSSYRVCRGGSWANGPVLLRVANRSRYSPDYRDYYLGFRCSEAP